MSARITVAGVTSLYVSAAVDGFPLEYAPSSRPGWMELGVSGAAGHIARVQRALGDEVRLCSPVGRDGAGLLIRRELARLGLLGAGIVPAAASSMGVVLVDGAGRRMGLPHLRPADVSGYPFEVLREQARGADLLVLTNARFVRPLVPDAAGLGVPIAVDVHRIADPDDAYDRPWLERAEIVFCSHERVGDPRAWVAAVLGRYPRCRMVGVGMGARGALLGLRGGALVTVDAVTPRPPVNTSGAGDSLFATFLHVLLRTGDPVEALRCGVVQAGWKIGHRVPAGASLAAADLAALRRSLRPPTALGRWDR
ncbi:carbohydrate kinase family protein [Actinomadura algeriensis]|uniref:Sugar/nucleoside kinase (Ribokinase family) n=1 Tax=Actinomadura algeriensis TaxID=1679523 RepID=A0ABR9JZR7_9ACTN|nr:PfkB family carbohydrate kinase [Actinomadura algeriensis]MBE1535874.1 sugar/nucleoside kinase (ribokinase family) [Actinomadura algeriensis]